MDLMKDSVHPAAYQEKASIGHQLCDVCYIQYFIKLRIYFLFKSKPGAPACFSVLQGRGMMA